MRVFFKRLLAGMTAAALCLCMAVQAQEPDGQIGEDAPPEEVPDEAAEEASLEVLLPYLDVSEDDWFYEALCWCIQQGLLQDIPLESQFQSDQPVTRAMFTTMLARLLAPDLVWSGSPVYSDVQPGSYYYEAVSWAANQGIVSGYGDGTFRPESC